MPQTNSVAGKKSKKCWDKLILLIISLYWEHGGTTCRNQRLEQCVHASTYCMVGQLWRRSIENLIEYPSAHEHLKFFYQQFPSLIWLPQTSLFKIPWLFLIKIGFPWSNNWIQNVRYSRGFRPQLRVILFNKTSSLRKKNIVETIVTPNVSFSLQWYQISRMFLQNITFS